MRANLSVIGMYNHNSNIFDNINLPDGVDREILVNNIVTDLAEMELLYSSAEFMETMIQIWSKKELPVWQKIYKACTASYDPIENYDRKEEWTDKGTGKANSSSTGTDISTEKVSGFNDDTLVNSSGSDSSNSGSGTSESESSSEHEGRVHGNIGVTTSQQMLEQELLIAPKLNIYSYITDSFKKRFCLLVY